MYFNSRKYHRIDFAQPGHVLQVAAAVAFLKGVQLKKVVGMKPARIAVLIVSSMICSISLGRCCEPT